MELIYTSQLTGFEKGRRYENARYFDPRSITKNITHAYIIGNWPNIVKAMQENDIAYTVLKVGDKISWRDGMAPEAAANIEYVEIEPTWKHFGAPRLIELAKAVAGREDITNRKQAVQIIERELERREAEDQSPTEEE